MRWQNSGGIYETLISMFMTALIGYPMYQYGYQEGVRDSAVDLSLEIIMLERYRANHQHLLDNPYFLDYYKTDAETEEQLVREYTEIIKSLRRISR